MSDPVQVHAVVSGRTDGPAVVLVHPIGTSMAVWDPQLTSLEGSFRVIRFDARGHGASDVPSGPYEMADFGRDLVALLDRLGVERANLAGQSLGGMTALWVAENAPDRVDSVVAFCVTARTASPDAWLARAARVRTDGVGAIRDLVLERWGYVGHRRDLAEWIVAQLLTTSDEGYAATCDAIADMDLEADLRSIRAPTLVVAGADDPAAPPAAAQAIAAAIPGGQAHTVAGSAHLLNREQPRAATRLITEHVLRARAARQAGDA